ncbi:MAG: hypothetical protein A3A24_03135 [Candidatus Buchananbacteria bacterium RIFCSPLOWO2_01_FULL_46_12]|uniref:DUF5673 domain-containing protein n=1 Tax=Candidatus Buchananbacteria bacterium RIFCSPLOWO2_01_FULL_46_12 TaxID=1797546 RepID=A0A1G1YQX8_9BACT|nr:MAG: hypothetical protein A3A24_03135 [Candidatus Buchananbacteria bacterium RIFCSPLOWO2_01_FULL_46_12]
MATENSTISGNNQPPDYGQVFFSWQFSELPQYQRSKAWYIWAAIGVLVLLFFAILTRNFLFGLIVILTSLIIILFQRNIQTVDFKIAEDGVLVNQRLYEYKNIKDFFIIYQPPTIKTLYFELKGFLNPRLPISLENQNPIQIREVLLQYLQEDLEREHEPVSDQFSRFFKL